MFLSWCVCNDVPSVCVCLIRSPFLTVARLFSLIYFVSFVLSMFLYQSFTLIQHTHDTIHIRLLNLTSLIYINLYSLHIRYIFARGCCFASRCCEKQLQSRKELLRSRNCNGLLRESRTRCKSHSLFMFPSAFFL